MNLVIVESPTKARKLRGYLGDEYHVEASVGHVRDLPEKKLGVEIEHDFEPTYEVSKGKKDVVAKLKKLASTSEKVYLAMDPDREGEAIAWHVQYLLSDQKKAPKQFLRSTFHEITKPAVLAAINQPSKLNLDLVNAQQARRILDRLVGYKVSPVLWKKVKRGLSAGRVQSVALRLIVEREKEITSFKAEEYWEIEVALAVNQALQQQWQQQAFKEGKPVENLPLEVINVSLQKVDTKKLSVASQDQATPIVEDLKRAQYVVKLVDQKEKSRQSLPPFTTSTLQQSAATRLGYSSKQTMRLAQQLYEEGLITYHRTDSVNLADSAVEMARQLIVKDFGPTYLPAAPRRFSNKSKNAQEAHEAIRVTDVSIKDRAILEKGGQLTEQHIKLYDLIWRRFLASQMNSAISLTTSLVVEGKTANHVYELRASGSIQKFDGWTVLFNSSQDSLLPEVKPNQPLFFTDMNPLQKFTQPPARYNDASLVKELEKLGIGRPSTYASIISVIVDRGYVERTDKKFFATPIGITVSDYLVKYFTVFMNYDFTAEMEEDLDRISLGQKEWKSVVKAFYAPLSEKITTALDEGEKVQIPVEKTGEACPVCGTTDHGEIVIRSGRFGKFKSCSRFPECKFTENIVEKVADMKCPLCREGEVILRKSRWGKPFYGCSRYPNCDWASWQKPAADLVVTPEEWAVQQAARAERAKARQKTSTPAKTAAKAKTSTKTKAKKTTAKKSTAKKGSRARKTE